MSYTYCRHVKTLYPEELFLQSPGSCSRIWSTPARSECLTLTLANDRTDEPFPDYSFHTLDTCPGIQNGDSTLNAF